MRNRFDIESLSKRLNASGPVVEIAKPGEPVAAVAIIIDMNRTNGAVLLIKRQVRAGDPWSGQIAFPGGHRRQSDLTLLETAIRETEEEVGIELRRHTVLGALRTMYSLSRKIPVAPFVFQLKIEAAVWPSHEVAESFWVRLSDLSRIASTRSEVFAQNSRLLVDSYVYDGHVIWGLTFRIVNTLLDRPQVDMV